MVEEKQYFDSLWENKIISKSTFLNLFTGFDNQHTELSNFINGTAYPVNFDKFKNYKLLTPAQGLSIICGLTPLQANEVDITDIGKYSKYLSNIDIHKRAIGDLAIFCPDEAQLTMRTLGRNARVTTYERLDGFSTYNFLRCLTHCAIKAGVQHPIEILDSDLKRLVGYFDLMMHIHTIMFRKLVGKCIPEMPKSSYPLKQYVEWAKKSMVKTFWINYLFEQFDLLPVQKKRELALNEWMKSKGYKSRDDIPIDNPQIWSELHNADPKLFPSNKSVMNSFFDYVREWFRYDTKYNYKRANQKSIETP